MTNTISAEDYNELAAKQKASKYGNKKVKEDGYTFDSQAEWRRYRELKLMEAAGRIYGLTHHPSYPISVNDCFIGKYIADFAYLDLDTDHLTIEDVKGVRTQAYQIKKKLIKALYGIDIVEIEA